MTITARGWKSIKLILDCRSNKTAKCILKRLGLLNYDGKTPILLIKEYEQKLKGK